MKRAVLAGNAGLTLAINGWAGTSEPSSAQSPPGTSPSGAGSDQVLHAQTQNAREGMQQPPAPINRTYPDVAYIYGSYAANIAQSGKTVNLANRINQPGFNWSDFYPASRQIASPGGKVIGFPALIDNLSVIYNKKLFAAAGVPAPSPDWTWDQFRAVAKKLTNPAQHIYGVNYPTGGDLLDTSWRVFPGLWQRGGPIPSPDPKKAPVKSPAGARKPTPWAQSGTVPPSVC